MVMWGLAIEIFADCSSVLAELEGMLSEEEYNEVLQFEQSFDEPSLGLDERFSAAEKLIRLGERTQDGGDTSPAEGFGALQL
jgi:hypothetical protein